MLDSNTTPSTSYPSASTGRYAVTAFPSTGRVAERQGNSGELTQEQQREVQQLQRRDREVRAHERAHMMAGRELVTRGADYTYQKGPDNKQYAVGGEVTIDTSPVHGDPQATRIKAGRIRETALAPAQPSTQDRAVAAKASRMAMQARIDILRQQTEEQGVAVGARSDNMQQAYHQVQSPQTESRAFFHQTA